MSNRLNVKICATCGAEFMGGPTATYCPSCRSGRIRQHDRERHQRKLAGQIRHIGSTAYCDICGKPYIVNAGPQKYCAECQEIERKKRWRESYERMKKDTERWKRAIQRSREWAGKNKDHMTEILRRSYERHKIEKNERRRIMYGVKLRPLGRTETCPRCGEPFVVRERHQVYCDKCRGQ